MGIRDWGLMKFLLLTSSFLFLLSACSTTREPPAESYSSMDELFASLESSAEQKHLVNYGKKYLGSRYVYGGETPAEGGFDCSGFTQYIYKNALGMNLPRTTKTQHQIGRPISRGRLEPGDLVFFDLTGHLSHVGVYIGGGKFFHASSGKKKLIIADMNKKYFAQRFNSAKRVLD